MEATSIVLLVLCISAALAGAGMKEYAILVLEEENYSFDFRSPRQTLIFLILTIAISALLYWAIKLLTS